MCTVLVRVLNMTWDFIWFFRAYSSTVVDDFMTNIKFMRIFSGLILLKMHICMQWQAEIGSFLLSFMHSSWWTLLLKFKILLNDSNWIGLRFHLHTLNISRCQFVLNKFHLKNEDTFEMISFRESFVQIFDCHRLDWCELCGICSIRKQFIVHHLSLDGRVCVRVCAWGVTHWPNCGNANVNGGTWNVPK